MTKLIFPYLMPGAGPLLLRGADSQTVGCLCLHGLAATPFEVRWLAEYLAAQGWTAHAPRLAGHGTDFTRLRFTSWQEWYLSALDAYHLLAQLTPQVVVIGHSMGGLLAILLAASQPVAGLALLATPVWMPEAERSLRSARWIRRTRPFLNMADTSGFPARLRAAQSQRGEPVRGRVRYDRWATGSLYELHLLMREAEHHLPAVSAPALLIYAENDTTTPILNQARIAARLGSRHIMQHTLAHSGHILPQDVEHETVFALVSDFVRHHLYSL